MDNTFAHSYTCEELIEVPNTATPRIYFPGASREGGHDGLTVEVHPAVGQAWIGTFAWGSVSPRGLSGVFTTPDIDRLCVVSRGDGYFVSASDPQAWTRVQATPVMDARLIPAKGLIVFADFTRLWAYGRGGLVWKREIGWDSLQITDVTEAIIKGEYWDAPRGVMADFAVDLETGSSRQ